VRVLVVDGANVVGSRPDGWWRDRPGAARRLHAALVAADLPAALALDEVVLVLEGAARRGVAAGVEGGVRTTHASGSGDDAVVATVTDLATGRPGDDVTVVTADRGLRARVEAAGGRCQGPSWLLELL